MEKKLLFMKLRFNGLIQEMTEIIIIIIINVTYVPWKHNKSSSDFLVLPIFGNSIEFPRHLKNMFLQPCLYGCAYELGL